MDSTVPMYDTPVWVTSLGPGVGGLGLTSCRDGWEEGTLLNACTVQHRERNTPRIRELLKLHWCCMHTFCINCHSKEW